LGLDYTFIKAIESSNIKAYFTKRTPNMGGSISGAKYILFSAHRKRSATEAATASLCQQRADPNLAKG